MSTTFEQMEMTIKRIQDGNIKADELRADFEEALANRSAIEAGIGKAFTVAELKKKFYGASGQTKAQLVDRYFDGLLAYYLLNRGFEYQPFSQTDSADAGRRRTLAEITNADIKAYAAERTAKSQEFVKAVTAPTTLEEFRTYLYCRKGGETSLTDDQLALYDILMADEAIREQEERDRQRAQIKQVEAPDGLVLTVKKGWHSKKLCDIWIVQLSDRVDRDVYNELADKAKRLGGHYSSFGPKENHGFIFWNEDDATKFAGVTEGDVDAIDRWERFEEARRQRAVDRLAEQAESKGLQAEDMLTRDRKTNTVRRAAMAESALWDADNLNKFAGVLQDISDALAADRLRYLRRLRFGTQVETLEMILRQAKYDRIRATAGSHNDEDWRRPVEIADVRHAKFPWPRVERNDIQNLIDACTGRRNIAGPRSYLLTALSKANGSSWVTVESREAVEAMIELLGRFDVPFGDTMMECTMDARRLFNMGITTLPQLRAALREFMSHREERPSKVDRIKLMELDMVGRNIPGYFPTPPDVVQKMIEWAEIQEWTMAILEPSAGKGNILDAIVNATPPKRHILHCCEVNYDLRAILQAKGYKLVGDDFMDFEPETHDYGDGDVETLLYERILMNPPFEDGQDMAHVRKAYSLLRPPVFPDRPANKYTAGGILVAIMSNSWTTSNSKAAQEFRDWLAEVDSDWEHLPEGSFKSSERPTGVATTIVKIRK